MVEVVVALGVMSTSLLATLGVIRSCSRAAYHSRMLDGSVLLAESLIGELHTTPPTAFEEIEGKKSPYQWQMILAETPVEGLAAVHIKITWQEQQRQQDYELITLIPIFVE